MSDTRDTEKLTCAADFLQRVNTEAGRADGW